MVNAAAASAAALVIWLVGMPTWLVTLLAGDADRQGLPCENRRCTFSYGADAAAASAAAPVIGLTGMVMGW